MFKIRFHPLVIILFMVSIALNKVGQFFILFFVITVHEFSHILASKKGKVKCIKWSFLPVGQAAFIEDLVLQPPWKQTIILLAGPMSNFIIAAIGHLFIMIDHPYVQFFLMSNIAIGIFNLLPIYPLDGGKILYGWLAHYRGNLQAMKQMLYLSRKWIELLKVFGIIQIILYPFNSSLLFICFYLNYINKKQQLFGTYELYKMMWIKQKYIDKTEMCNFVYCRRTHVETSFAKILQTFSTSRYDVFLVQTKTIQQPQIIFEKELFAYILKYGMEGTIEDYLEFQKNQAKC